MARDDSDAELEQLGTDQDSDQDSGQESDQDTAGRSTRTARPAARALHAFIQRAAGTGPLPRDERGRLLSEKKIVEGLDRNERVLGTILALLIVAVAVFVLVYAYEYHPKKGQAPVDWATIWTNIGVLAGAAALMLLGIGIKRRALVGFSALLLGLMILNSPTLGILAFVYLGFAAWLLYRSYKLGKQRREVSMQASARRSARAGAAGPTRSGAAGSGSSRTGSSRAGSGHTSSSKRRGQADPATRRPPPASKRYTPPRPPRRPSSSNGASR